MASYDGYLDEERRRGQMKGLDPNWSGDLVSGPGNPYAPPQSNDAPPPAETGPGFQTDFPSADPNYSGGTATDLAGTLPNYTPNAVTTTTGSGGGGGARQQAAFAPAQSMSFQQTVSSGGGGGGGGSAPTTKTPAITDEVTNLLRQRLKDLSNPLDVTSDPIFQNQIKAHDVTSQRNAERARASLAQRGAATGTLSSGGFNTGVRSLGEQQGRENQAFSANLAGTRLADRETQLNSAISMARAVGQDDVAMQLEDQKLALQQQALALQKELGLGDLDLRRFLGQGQLGLGQGQLDLGYGNLGYNYAQLLNQMNRQGVNDAMGIG